MSDLVDKLGRKLLECPADKRGQYPASPVCCGEPQVLYFACTINEPDRPLVWGGHLLRCNSCGAYEEVDLFFTSINFGGGWWRQVD